MSELKMVSPLLDHMRMEKETSRLGGQTCYILRDEITGEHYVLKCLSLPETDSRIRALILSGAYPDEQAVHSYYGRLVEDIEAELEAGKKLAASGCFAGALSYQVEPKESGVGFDIYILYPLNISLREFLATNAITGLRAINLGLDLCDSIEACREAGYLFQNLRPENIFLMPTGKFLLGDLGLTSLQDLQYASVPEEYIGPYSAPELSDIAASPNLTIDLYSLGMVLYRIYNGNHGPFEDESTSEAMSDKLRLTGKPLPSPIYADYELAGIILKACAFRQEDRYQSPEELKQALVLYMQRNAVSDTLIVPPIVADLDPVPLIDDEPEDEPVRMTDVEDLDDNFKQSFSPDLTGAGNETLQQEEPEEAEPVSVPDQEEENASAGEQPADQSVQQEEEKDPDQMDLDSLLASINSVIGEEASQAQTTEPAAGSKEAPAVNAAAPVPASGQTDKAKEATHAYVDSAPDEPAEDEPKKPRKKSKILLWVIVVLLVAGIAVAGYFLLQWYFLEVYELKTVSTTPSEIVVELVTDEKPSYYHVTCSDNFGNVFNGVREGSYYRFTGLKEETSYTINVVAEKYHDFTGAVPDLTESTNAYTEISDISFERLNTDGDVLFSFNHKGPIPAEWQLTYEKKSGGDRHTYHFSGDSYQINGLELYETYVFTLENTENIFLRGNCSAENKVLPRVTASNLAVKNIADNIVTLTWDCGDIKPTTWTVTCEAPGTDTITREVSKAEIQLALKDLSRDYTVSVFAEGMDKPEVITVTADPIIINKLRAEPDGSGNITVTWETPAGQPEGNWSVSCAITSIDYNKNSLNTILYAACPADGSNTVTFPHLPAAAEFEFHLMALDTNSNSYPVVFGTTVVKAETPKADPFSGYELTPPPPLGDGYEAETSIALWKKPDAQVWDYRDLLTARRTSYSADEKIAFCVQIDGLMYSEDPVYVAYVVRNEAGQVVATDGRELPWNKVWFSRRHTGEIPLPYGEDESGNPVVAPGKYSLEIYISNKLLAVKNFKIQ